MYQNGDCFFYICSKFKNIQPNKIHIVSFDVPFPADYGGVIDVFYKIKALSEAGVDIILHAFTYGRNEAPILNEFCKEVYYYKRKLSPHLLLGKTPFLVSGRQSALLLKRLSADNSPILFEGLHTCFYLDHASLLGKKKFVRSHNIEHDYYYSLAEAETKVFKKKYLSQEAKKLKLFEPILKNAQGVAAISKNDNIYLLSQGYNSEHISAFHSNNKIKSKLGRGKFALYHGNLAVSENDLAAIFLVKNIFNKIDIPLIIAGNKPSAELIELCKKTPNITLKYNITNEEIMELISEAHVNVLPTFQPTGIKLKLLAALFNGRFCIANSFMVENTGLEDYCTICNEPEKFMEELKIIFEKDFTKMDLDFRKKIEQSTFSNNYNLKKLMEFLF